MQTITSRAAFALLLLLSLFSVGALAQSAPNSTAAKLAASPAAVSHALHADGDARAERNLEVARANPLSLRALLIKMPKGADLHNHLSGAVYAESWIRAGAEDGLCVDLAKHSFVRAPATAATQSYAAQPACAEGQVPAAQAFKDQHLYDDLINAFSMRSFVPSPGVSAHDHFFDTFAKFDGTSPRHTGEWLDEVATRAASQNEQYLELMETPDFTRTATLARELGWQDDFAQFRDSLLAHGLRDDVATARAHFDEADALRFQREHCGMADASPACNVQIRYLYYVLRGFPKEQVFAQALLGFEVASADPRVVGVNIVMPEDGYISMTDYALHMRIFAFLHGLYPKVHISLHAGEISPGLVPYEGLCCHIRLAVEQAHAERIGHGVEVMYENKPHELLKEMAAKHVMVEINLTSNDVILGVSGMEDPFPIYRQFGVPVALSTDDEGVSRIDLTHEYVRAVETYNLHYADLKQLVRTGLEHSFLPGASLWREQDGFGRPVAACAHDSLGGEKRSSACEEFLKSSGKAQQQWELERRFHEFEAGL
jgi:adenosine deaminase